MLKNKLKLKKGARYLLSYSGGSGEKGRREKFVGHLYSYDKHKLIIQGKNYKESFLMSDILIGELSIKEI